jgi:hypothetical protein
MTRHSTWSQALPYVVATLVYLSGIGVALSLPVTTHSSTVTVAVGPVPMPSPTCGESPASSSVYFETDDETEAGSVLDGVHFLCEPLLRGSSMDPLTTDNEV